MYVNKIRLEPAQLRLGNLVDPRVKDISQRRPWDTMGHTMNWDTIQFVPLIHRLEQPIVKHKY
ncbi:MAG: hypothetical protein AMJ93_13390 [Anaerolineae bacterium SM23_84]|nr:MAG: hypothetical protein AMJ93_13390 [Anaerolineae bacterium SM23_84]